MKHICLVLPILPGKITAANAFMDELGNQRNKERHQCEQRIGITVQTWYLAQGLASAHIVVFLTSQDLSRALQLFSASPHVFDLWFKDELAHVTGINLHDLPFDRRLFELLEGYGAETSATH